VKARFYNVIDLKRIRLNKNSPYHVKKYFSYSSAVLCIALCFASFPAKCQLFDNSFKERVDLRTGISPYSISHNDLDGDGLSELIVANAGSYSVSVFKNSSSSDLLSFEPRVDHTAGDGPRSVSSADFDGDGKIDIVVTNQHSNSISLFSNLTSNGGTIDFSLQSNYNTAQSPISVAIGDLTNDGKADLVVTNVNSDNLSVFTNISESHGVYFTTDKLFSTGSQPNDIKIADLNQDGLMDVVVSNGNSHNLFIYIGSTQNANNTELSNPIVVETGFSPMSIGIADLNGDTFPDLAVVNNLSNTISIFQNLGASNVSFAEKIDLITNSEPRQLAIGDLDNDGLKDFAITNGSNQTISLFRNSTSNGVVSFDDKVDLQMSSESNLYGIQIANVGGDALLDIIFTDLNQRVVSILENNSNNREKSTATDFKSFYINEQIGATSINTVDHTIDLKVLANESLNATKPIFYLSEGASLYFDSILQISGQSEVDFTNYTLQYKIVAEDGLSSQEWAVRIEESQAPPVITSFSPAEGKPGTLVTIYGSGFNENVNKNTVFFGSIKGEIINSTQTEIQVSASFGATNNPLFVVNEGLMGYASDAFVTLFEGPELASSFFSNTTTAEVGSLPEIIRSGDFNDDGKLDLVVANQSGESISILQNATVNKTIIFETQKIYEVGYPCGISIADIDTDGRLDIVVLNKRASNISVFINKSNTGGVIQFDQRIDYKTKKWPSSLSISDFDLDGKPDIVVVNSGENSFSIFQNNSTPSQLELLEPLVFPFGVEELLAVDMNKDAKPDLVFSNGSTTLSIMLNESSGSGNIRFGSSLEFELSASPSLIALNDLDGDGLFDLVYSSWSSNAIFTAKNNGINSGTGAFAEEIKYSAQKQTARLELGDLDGDGKLDILTTSMSGCQIKIYRNTSDDSSVLFETIPSFGECGVRFGSAIGDFNNDGRADIAFTNFDRGNISVVENTGDHLELGLDNSERIYPNPVKDNLLIPYDVHGNRSLKITIYSLQGKIVYQGKHNEQAEQNIEINLSKTKVKPGIYMITLSDEANDSFQTLSQKILIEGAN
jgi:hypothetical protein